MAMAMGNASRDQDGGDAGASRAAAPGGNAATAAIAAATTIANGLAALGSQQRWSDAAAALGANGLAPPALGEGEQES